MGTGAAFSLSLVNHDFTTSNCFDLCTRHIKVLLTWRTLASEKRCSPEAPGGAEGGLSLQHWSFTLCKQEGNSCPRRGNSLLSGSLIFFPGVLKRQLFCFVLVGNRNIRWHTHPNPHNKIWIGTQRVRVRPPDLAHKNAEYSLKFGFQLNDKSFYRRSASHSIFEKCAKKSYLVVS